MTDIPLTIKVKVAKMGNSLRMTIPVPVANAIEIKSGDWVEIGVEDNKMIVMKSEKPKEI